MISLSEAAAGILGIEFAHLAVSFLLLLHPRFFQVLVSLFAGEYSERFLRQFLATVALCFAGAAIVAFAAALGGIQASGLHFGFMPSSWAV